ncbi:hypothetical protein GBA52_026369 [Prunus armeniaca]|nr:hypothetical protein GBA52_026369 [Prunus armeniaca]
MFGRQLRKQLWSLPRRPSEESFVKVLMLQRTLKCKKLFLLLQRIFCQPVSSPYAHLKTRLTVFRNELPENATDTASEFSSLQEFLEVQAVKIPALQEGLGVAYFIS